MTERPMEIQCSAIVASPRRTRVVDSCPSNARIDRLKPAPPKKRGRHPLQRMPASIVGGSHVRRFSVYAASELEPQFQ
jgi:hypothetical protein